MSVDCEADGSCIASAVIINYLVVSGAGHSTLAAHFPFLKIVYG